MQAREGGLRTMLSTRLERESRASDMNMLLL